MPDTSKLNGDSANGDLGPIRRPYESEPLDDVPTLRTQAQRDEFERQQRHGWEHRSD